MMENKWDEPADIMIYVKDKGIVLKEKSLAAFDEKECRLIAVGNDAENVSRDSEAGIIVVSPLRQGMITDFMVAREMFRLLLEKAGVRLKGIRRKGAVICIPKGVTEVEKKAYDDLFCVIFNTGNIYLADMGKDELIRNMPEIYDKYNILIEITKDDPALYVKEQLRKAFTYAKENRIAGKELDQIWKGILEE